MRTIFTYIILTLAICLNISAQDEEVPSSPLLTFLTVIPETGKTYMTWNLSPSPDVAGYIIYNYRNGEGFAFDTIWNPAADNYLNNGSFSAYLGESYVIAAIDSSDNVSPLSNVLSTVFATTTLDTCNNKLIIGWNMYLPSPKEVTGYRIMKSVNNGVFEEAGITDASITSFTLDSFETDKQYCIIVTALLQGGLESKSNRSCITTEMERPPGWVNADYATIRDGKVVLSFTPDPATELERYRLEKRKVTEAQFTEIALLTSEDHIIEYTDITADPEEIYIYRLSALNNCGIPIAFSNNASNIAASVTRENNSILLKWNEYKYWLGGVADYRILVNTGNGFTEMEILSPSDTIHAISYSDLMYQTSTGEICFIVEARENSNIHGIAGESSSAPVCTEVTEIVSVPNAFTPNGDLTNDLFIPVFTFTPQEYSLIITDLNNRRLFESDSFSEAWDGTSKGVLQPQGVYLYYLRVKAPSGKIISKSGTITILDN